MAKDPAFLFYTNDFSSGTQFFTDEQLGIYLRLLMAQHQHGHLSEKQVNFICKSYDKDILIKFETDENGLYFNRRLDEEIFKRKRFTESRSNNKSGRKKLITNELEKENQNEESNHMLIINKSYDNHMENKNINRNKDINKEIVKRSKQKEDQLEFPYYGEDFKNAWDLLLKNKKWKTKNNNSLQLSLNKLKNFNEEFSIKLIYEAIEKDWSGLVYENTEIKFNDFLNAKNGIIKNSNYKIGPAEHAYRTNLEAQQIIEDFYKNNQDEQYPTY